MCCPRRRTKQWAAGEKKFFFFINGTILRRSERDGASRNGFVSSALAANVGKCARTTCLKAAFVKRFIDRKMLYDISEPFKAWTLSNSWTLNFSIWTIESLWLNWIYFSRNRYSHFLASNSLPTCWRALRRSLSTFIPNRTSFVLFPSLVTAHNNKIRKNIQLYQWVFSFCQETHWSWICCAIEFASIHIRFVI